MGLEGGGGGGGSKTTSSSIIVYIFGVMKYNSGIHPS